VLAIRAQELLRASLVEFLVEENRPNPAIAPPSPQIHRWVKQAVESRVAPWTLGLELGATTFGGWGGIGPAVAPAARLRMALGERFWARLTALGLGSGPRVNWNSTSSASVSQSLVLLEVASWLRPRRLVRPLFSLGLGLERVAVEGAATLPYQGERNARWFVAGDAAWASRFACRRIGKYNSKCMRCSRRRGPPSDSWTRNSQRPGNRPCWPF